MQQAYGSQTQPYINSGFYNSQGYPGYNLPGELGGLPCRRVVSLDLHSLRAPLAAKALALPSASAPFHFAPHVPARDPHELAPVPAGFFSFSRPV